MRPLFYFYSCLCAQLDKGFGSLGEAVIKISDKDLPDWFLGVEFTLKTLS